MLSKSGRTDKSNKLNNVILFALYPSPITGLLQMYLDVFIKFYYFFKREIISITFIIHPMSLNPPISTPFFLIHSMVGNQHDISYPVIISYSSNKDKAYLSNYSTMIPWPLARCPSSFSWPRKTEQGEPLLHD